MKIGMLWYDNDPKTTLEQKIEKAAAYYREKYGAEPNCCFVHKNCGVTVLGIEVKESHQVLPNHLWLGVENGH